jgi:quercetin dioxygenase-like cupin family protein
MAAQEAPDLDEQRHTVDAAGTDVRSPDGTATRERRPPMSFDPRGYVLSADSGDSLWFLDTRMTVLAGGDQTGGAFTFLEWEAAQGFGPPRHIHHREDEAFYVLDGELAVECGDRGWTVGPGGFVFLPHDIAHAFVVSKGPARGLQITSPAGFERFITELGRPAERAGVPEPSVPDIARLSSVMTRYGYEMVGPPLTLPPESATSGA